MIEDWIEEYYEENGHSRETTNCILRDIKQALLDQAVVVEIQIVADDNAY